MAKEHWTKRIKRENAELKTENERLKSGVSTGTDYTDLKSAIAEDVKVYTVNEVIQALSPTDIIQKAYELVMERRTGEMREMQAIRLTDSKYWILTEQMFDRILKETKVDKIKYQKEKNDCEDIARKMVDICHDLGINSVGRAFSWGGGHSFDVVLVRNENGNIILRAFEPQTDRYVEFTGQYTLENMLVIIS